MIVLKISAIAVLVTIVSLVLKQYRPDLAMLVSVAGGIIVLLYVSKQLASILGWFDVVSSKTNISSNILSLLLKIVGIGYVAEFAASACEDAGNKSMAEKICLGAKIAIFSISIPILTSVVDSIVSVL